MPARQAPASAARRVVLLLRVMATMSRVEAGLRRRPLGALGESLGVSLAGFSSAPTTAVPLPHVVSAEWWAVEAVLAWWPFARDRQCLRRSLVLGARVSYLRPSLHLEVVRLQPFLAHAWLLVNGQRLDMGETSLAPRGAEIVAR